MSHGPFSMDELARMSGGFKNETSDTAQARALVAAKRPVDRAVTYTCPSCGHRFDEPKDDDDRSPSPVEQVSCPECGVPHLAGDYAS